MKPNTGAVQTPSQNGNPEVDANPEDGKVTQKLLSPREEQLQRIEARYEELRGDGEPFEETVSRNPAEDIPQGTPTAEAEAEDDEVHEFIVRKEGKAFFRTKVDGAEKLIPLSAAQQQLQKHEAADVRLQKAAETAKELTERENRLKAQELVVAAKAKISSPLPATADADDQGLKKEATELVTSLTSDSDEVGAEKLVKFVKKLQPVQPVVNIDEITESVTQKVKTKLTEDQQQKDIATGYTKFQTDYPDIANDPDLFALADSKTSSIVQEHPEWSPSQVMLEAGKRTKEWVEGMKTPVAPTPPGNDRQNAKEKLRQIPLQRSAHQAAEQDAPADTPQSVVESIRKARGQA